MNLDNFENVVEPKIIDRGFDYYESDLIEEIEQVEKNEFSATVLGSEQYNVFVKLDGQQNIMEHTCDCPYDWGNTCKHEVAVFYYLKDSELYNEPISKGKISTIKKDLKKYNKNELITMITELSKRSKHIRDELLWELGYDET